MSIASGMRSHRWFTMVLVLCALGALLGSFSLARAAAQSQLTATWEDTTNDQDGFALVRKNGAGTYAPLATLGPTVLSYVDTTVTVGMTYCYQVAAFNAAGTSPFSNEACTTVAAPVVDTLTLAKSGTGSGTVTSSPAGISCGTTCIASFTGGTSLALSATPATGSTFTGWSGACTGTGTCTAILDAAKTVTATFTAQSVSYALTLTKSGTGSGTVTSSPAGISCGTTCIASFTGGTSLALSATPATGSTFTGWSGACSGTGSCTVTLSQAQSVTATFDPTPSTSGVLVAAYAFDEGTGATLADASGNGHTGTIQGATWASGGKYGHALTFPGTSNSVTIKNSALLDIAGAGLTLEFWVNPTDISGRDEVLVAKGWQAGAMVAPWYQYGIEFSGDRKQLDLYLGFSGGVGVGPISLTPATGSWTHVAFTYDGAMIRGYVNGVQQVAVPETRSLQARGTDLLLGADAALGQPYLGLLDELRIYNRALTATELQADMVSPVGGSAQLPPTATGLTANKAAPQVVNTPITFTATFTGGVAPYQTKWWLLVGTTATLLQDWTTGTSFTWTPTTPNAAYRISVWGRSAGSTVNNGAVGRVLAFPITP